MVPKTAFKRIFEYTQIFEYFPPNIDIRIRFVADVNAIRYIKYHFVYLGMDLTKRCVPPSNEGSLLLVVVILAIEKLF